MSNREIIINIRCIRVDFFFWAHSFSFTESYTVTIPYVPSSKTSYFMAAGYFTVSVYFNFFNQAFHT